VLATLFADDTISGKVFGSRCSCGHRHEHNRAHLEEEIARRIPQIEIVCGRDAEPILGRFGRPVRAVEAAAMNLTL
jgi:hypothetical protein